MDKKYNINLNRSMLLIGAIQPDFQKGKNKINHTYSVSINKIKQLENQLNDTKLNSSEFALKVGNIAHFIADSFCKYHVEKYYGRNMIRHYIYEFLLEMKILNIIFFDRDIVEAILYDIETLDKSCFSSLSENRQNYLTLKEHILNDLYYAIKTTGFLIYKMSNISNNHTNK